MVSVTTKYSGFIEKVYVNYVGEPVKRGQPLFDIYSPELVQTEQELLSAQEFAQRMERGTDDARARAPHPWSKLPASASPTGTSPRPRSST